MTTPGSESPKQALRAAPPVSANFAWATTEAGSVLRSTALAEHASHAFTTRTLTFQPDRAAADRSRLARSLGATAEDLFEVQQVHGRTVRVIAGETTADASIEGLTSADAIVSSDLGRVIVVYVADCVPILIADRRQRVVAAVHAGWRGTCAGIAIAAVEAIKNLSVPPEDLVAALGPSIGPCCYQVDEKVRTAFLGMTPDAVAWFAEDGHEHWKLDLWQANRDQLEESGVPASAIHSCNLCTADHLETHFSYRRQGSGAGRLAAAIRLGPPSS